MVTLPWRPLTELAQGMRVGVLWSQPPGGSDAHFMVFVDGEEVVKMSVPEHHGELFMLVDLQGRVRSASVVQRATFPDLH